MRFACILGICARASNVTRSAVHRHSRRVAFTIRGRALRGGSTLHTCAGVDLPVNPHRRSHHLRCSWYPWDVLMCAKLTLNCVLICYATGYRFLFSAYILITHWLNACIQFIIFLFKIIFYNKHI